VPAPADGLDGDGRVPALALTRAVLERARDVVETAALLGLELREGRQRCPWHDGRSARSLQVSGRLWRCHAGCGGGTVIHLAARVLRVSYRDAREALAGLLGLARRDVLTRGVTPPRGGGGRRAPALFRRSSVALDEGVTTSEAEPYARG
jgi:hypothetical protein